MPERNDIPPRPRRSTFVAGRSLSLLVGFAIVALYLSLAIGLASTRLTWRDEAHFANPAHNLAVSGKMGTTVIEADDSFLKGIHEHTYWILPLYPVMLAGWIKVFGFSLFTVRLFGVMWGLVVLAAWYVIVTTLFRDWRATLLALTLVSTDYFLVNLAATARMDVMCAALGLAGYAAYLRWRETNLSLAVLLSQSLIVASGLTHPNGLFYFAGLLFLTISLDRPSLQWKLVGIALVPYLTGALAWGFYILQSPSDFIAQFFGNIHGYAQLTGKKRWSAMSEPLLALPREIKLRYLDSFGLGPLSQGMARLKVVILITYLSAIIGCIAIKRLRHEKALRILVTLTAIVFVMMTVLEGSKAAMYLTHMTPMLAALTGCWLFCDIVHLRWSRGWVVAGLIGVVLLQVAGLVQLIRRNPLGNEYLPTVTVIKSLHQPGAPIIGSAELAFGLGFDSVVDDIRLGYYSRRRPDVIAFSGWYESILETYIKQSEPAVYDFIRERLNNEYRLAQVSQYHWKIYVRAANP